MSGFWDWIKGKGEGPEPELPVAIGPQGNSNNTPPKIASIKMDDVLLQLEMAATSLEQIAQGVKEPERFARAALRFIAEVNHKTSSAAGSLTTLICELKLYADIFLRMANGQEYPPEDLKTFAFRCDSAALQSWNQMSTRSCGCHIVRATGEILLCPEHQDGRGGRQAFVPATPKEEA